MTSADRENPRTTRVRRVILDSGMELLLDKGASEVTAARIAEETGVARTTIYRQWPDQPGLLLATIEALVSSHYPAPDTGDLRSDLMTAMTQLRHRLETKQVRPVFAALVDYAERDDAFSAAQRTFVEGLIQPTFDVLDQAQDRGDIPASLDPTLATHTLVGPLLHQFLVMRAPIGDDLIDACMEQFAASYLSG